MNARKGDVVWVVWNGTDAQLYSDEAKAHAAAMDLIDAHVAAGMPFDCRHGQFVGWYCDEDGHNYVVDVSSRCIR